MSRRVPLIVFVGPMGAGKTTIGKILAKELSFNFYDSDKEIERRTGANIPWIFDVEGESGFRDRETNVIRELVELTDVVLATGGGAMMRPENRSFVKQAGFVVYLNTSVDQQYKRTHKDKNRPLLQGESDARKVLADLYEKRDPLYREVADYVVDTDNKSMKAIVKEIVRAVESSEMIELKVDLKDRDYPIFIGEALLSDTSLYEPYISGKKVMIVTNETVGPLYEQQVRQALVGYEVDTVTLPDGEQYKNWQTLNLIFDALLEKGAFSKNNNYSVRGGVVGDMAGFAASAYQRGVDFIQVPTTLLSQVDSSVGGKTAINHPLGKNMIGAFYQPKAVIIDILTLQTLAAKEVSAGLAEVIKYGLIRKPGFFEWLENNISALKALDSKALSYAIKESCSCKAEVVEIDEKEGGLRAILNLGHTFGHAIETFEGYGAWLHGEAVAAGTVMAAELSVLEGWINEADLNRIKQILNEADLPVIGPEGMLSSDYQQLMAVDKKVLDGTLRLVLLKAIGEAVVSSDFSAENLSKVLRSN